MDFRSPSSFSRKRESSVLSTEQLGPRFREDDKLLPIAYAISNRKTDMCLAIPVKVVELREGDQAMVDVGGVRKEISLALVDGIAVGDYVILHVGYAIQKLDLEEAEKTLALFSELGENLGAAPA